MTKRCPICGLEKPIEEYHRYFSKERNKQRYGNYCKPCARKEANVRAKEYYRNNRNKVLEYQNVIRKDWKRKKGIEDIKNLSDRYILSKLQQTTNYTPNSVLRQIPELITSKRAKIILYRIKRKLNGKK